MITKPEPSEFNPFYAGYVGKVPPAGPVALLKDQIAAFDKLRALPEDRGNYRYAEGKWSVKELLGHVADGERLFTYRLLHIARGDQAPLPGMDENVWAASAPHDRRPIAAIVDELIAVRRATLALVESLDEAAVARTGVANNNPVTVRALCWVIAGHPQHHLDVLRERYAINP
jgi:uncharacterized damage-inducible protein DinB